MERTETKCRGCGRVIAAGEARIHVEADASLVVEHQATLPTIWNFCGVECAWNLFSIELEDQEKAARKASRAGRKAKTPKADTPETVAEKAKSARAVGDAFKSAFGGKS
jgi:hypothetical protein